MKTITEKCRLESCDAKKLRRGNDIPFGSEAYRTIDSVTDEGWRFQVTFTDGFQRAYVYDELITRLRWEKKAKVSK